MKFDISDELTPYIQEPVIGNVYNVRGGSGARKGYMFVIISIVGTTATTVTINKSGEIVGGGNYGLHYFEDKCPMAFCKGLEELAFSLETI